MLHLTSFTSTVLQHQFFFLVSAALKYAKNDQTCTAQTCVFILLVLFGSMKLAQCASSMNNSFCSQKSQKGDNKSNFYIIITF